MAKRTHSTKPATVKRSASFAFRCSDEDRANIRKLAEHEERTEGDTVRVVLRRAAEALS